MGREADDFEWVADRAGHDLRYAIDSSVLREELGWAPQYTDLETGLEQTIAWYREHRSWWEPGKAQTEERYRVQLAAEVRVAS
jgi:dTDP-glucose 4,6-dehydratase